MQTQGKDMQTAQQTWLYLDMYMVNSVVKRLTKNATILSILKR